MNDLLSTTSFRKYTNLKQQVQMDQMEAGMSCEGEGEGEAGVNLNKFFEEVESVKSDLRGLEGLYRQLQEANEESKTAHSAKMMKEVRGRMDADIGKVLRCAKQVKAKLEGLDRANAQSRTLPGCGPGSSADRTRTSVVSGLGKKLKDLMDDFQGLRARIAAEYKETVGRRYYTVTGEAADEATVEALVATGEGERFLQRAIEEQGRGRVLEVVAEIRERHGAVAELERSLQELQQVFMDMAVLVEAQGQQLDDIESNVGRAQSFVHRGTEHLGNARTYQKNTRKWTCIAILLLLIIILIIVLPIVLSLKK